MLMKGARVIDPASGLDGVCDLLVQEGRIRQIGQALDGTGEDVLDAQGLVLAPGLVDMHVHLRDPGLTHKEDIHTGCAAAAAGGFTAVACMPNTKPACDTPETVRYIVDKAKDAAARVYPVGTISRGMAGEALSDFRALKQAGAVALSDDGKPVPSNRLLLAALHAARAEHLPVVYHAEDLEITNSGLMHEGEVSLRIQAAGVNRASEDVSTAQAIALAASVDLPVHICHVSTAGAIALIRDAKRRGVRVTCETGPHYFTLTHEKLLTRDANFRMAPPLREESDRLAVLEGLIDGTIDCIATDHAPHTPEEKADFKTAPNGVIGLETSLAVSLTMLVHGGKISLPRLIELMSTTPAKLLGQSGGRLAQDAPADLVLFDPNEEWTVDKNKFVSKARNTCFDGMRVHGRVKYTFLNGRMTYQDI